MKSYKQMQRNDMLMELEASEDFTPNSVLHYLNQNGFPDSNLCQIHFLFYLLLPVDFTDLQKKRGNTKA